MKYVKLSRSQKLWFKRAFFLFANAFLIYQFLQFEHWSELVESIRGIPLHQYAFLLLTILLIPLNWSLEVFKWRFLTSPIKHLSLYQAFRSVFMGLAAGLITPGKIGDWPGRSLVFEKKKRVKITLIAQFNSLIKTIALSLVGLISWTAYEFTFNQNLALNRNLTLTSLLILSVLLFAFLFSRWFINLLLNTFSKKDAAQSDATWITSKYRLTALAFSIFRSLIFSLQFILLSRFFLGAVFGPELYLIPPIYFFILTFIPAFSFADPGIRGSIALLLFQNMSVNGPIMAIIGISLWTLNTVLPFLVGSIVFKESHPSRS